MLEKDPNNKQLSKIDDSVDELQQELEIILREFDGIKQVTKYTAPNNISAHLQTTCLYTF